MHSLTDLITVRAIKTSDINFILDASIRCLSTTSTMYKYYNTDTLYNHIELQLLCVLSDYATYSSFIVCDKDDEDDIFAFIVVDTKENHVMFEYTKYAFRKMGLQKYFLIPLCLNPHKQITMNYPTKDAIQLHKSGKVVIENKLMDKLIREK